MTISPTQVARLKRGIKIKVKPTNTMVFVGCSKPSEAEEPKRNNAKKLQPDDLLELFLSYRRQNDNSEEQYQIVKMGKSLSMQGTITLIDIFTPRTVFAKKFGLNPDILKIYSKRHHVAQTITLDEKRIICIPLS